MNDTPDDRPAPEPKVTHYNDLKAYKMGGLGALVMLCGAQSKTIKVSPFPASVTCPACLDALAKLPPPEDQALTIQGAPPAAALQPGAPTLPASLPIAAAPVPTTPGPAVLADGTPITVNAPTPQE